MVKIQFVTFGCLIYFLLVALFCDPFYNGVLLLLDMNAQADSLIESGQFDTASIQEKRQSINERYERIKNLAAHRQARLNEANTLHQFFRDIADEESWIK
jgi:hypothetical protein